MGWTCEVMKETEGAQDNKTIIPASELRSLSKLRFVAEIAVCGIHKQIPLKCSRSQMFFKVGVLRNFPIFTGKHLFLQNTSGRLLTPFFWLGIIVFVRTHGNYLGSIHHKYWVWYHRDPLFFGTTNIQGSGPYFKDCCQILLAIYHL